MAEFDTRIQQKSDTQANFESNNPILLANELVIVKMTDGSIKFKIGDGISHFNSLQYTDKYLIDDIDNIDNNISNINSTLSTKANLTSPNFSGTPTAPTASAGTNNTQIATTAFVVNAVSSTSQNIQYQIIQNGNSGFILQSKSGEGEWENVSTIGALPLTGGTLTGNLTGKYITGTWLQGTAPNHLNQVPQRICVQDSAGWVYSRTPAEILGDIGATEIVVSTSQPSSQTVGSFWYKIV